jgi:CHAT domain-containing protein
LINRAENFLNKAGISEELKNRIVSELTVTKNRITSQAEVGNYTLAWRLYKNMESRVLKLVWQYRNRLVSEYRNLVARENNIEKNLERLQQLRNIRNRIASGGQGR